MWFWSALAVGGVTGTVLGAIQGGISAAMDESEKEEGTLLVVDASDADGEPGRVRASPPRARAGRPLTRPGADGRLSYRYSTRTSGPRAGRRAGSPRTRRPRGSSTGPGLARPARDRVGPVPVERDRAVERPLRVARDVGAERSGERGRRRIPPAEARIAGATNTCAVANTLPGLPGRPSTGVPCFARPNSTGLPGHRDLPHRHLAGAGEDVAHPVVLAHRRAPARHEEVGAVGPPREPRLDALGPVGPGPPRRRRRPPERRARRAAFR